MKKKYSKTQVNRICIDKQISLVMMTDEGAPPDSPFLQIKETPKSDPYKA